MCRTPLPARCPAREGASWPVFYEGLLTPMPGPSCYLMLTFAAADDEGIIKAGWDTHAVCSVELGVEKAPVY